MVPPAAPVLVKLPVTKGMFWPTMILASSLSSVSRVGVDSTLPVPVLWMKLARMPSARVPRARLKPVLGRRPARSAAEGARLAGRRLMPNAAAAMSRMLVVPPVP